MFTTKLKVTVTIVLSKAQLHLERSYYPYLMAVFLIEKGVLIKNFNKVKY